MGARARRASIVDDALSSRLCPCGLDRLAATLRRMGHPAHSSCHVVIAGAGVAGLASALILGRAGHRVTLLERDALPASGPPGSWFDWKRRGIPHFHQPHAFIPRGRALLREVA